MRESRSFVVWDALPDAAAAISVVNAGSFYSPDEPGRRPGLATGNHNDGAWGGSSVVRVSIRVLVVSVLPMVPDPGRAWPPWAWREPDRSGVVTGSVIDWDQNVLGAFD